MTKAVVLLSGGLDSATAAAIARAEGYELHAISFDYGQRHARELEGAKAVAKSLGAAGHLIVRFDLRGIGGSALTDDMDVPLDTGIESRKSKAERETGADLQSEISNLKSEIPVTYVPARNTIFLSFALGYAESLSAFDIFIGVSAVDYSGYPDCRPEFIESFERTANLATKAAVEGKGRFKIHAPLVGLSKAETIRRGLELGVDYSLTWSCYLGGERPCGRCDSCKLRLAGFTAAGAVDPLDYT